MIIVMEKIETLEKLLHPSISTALKRPRRPKLYCLQLDIALWHTKLYFHVQIEHSARMSHCYQHCTCSLVFSSLSTLAWLRQYHKCEIVWGDHIGSPPSQHQHCTDKFQKAKQYCLQLNQISYIYFTHTTFTNFVYRAKQISVEF